MYSVKKKRPIRSWFVKSANVDGILESEHSTNKPS